MTTDTKTVILLALPTYPYEFLNREDYQMLPREEVVEVKGNNVRYLLQKFRDSSEMDVYELIGYTKDRTHAEVTYVGPIEDILKKAFEERGYGDRFNFFNPIKNINVPYRDIEDVHDQDIWE